MSSSEGGHHHFEGVKFLVGAAAFVVVISGLKTAQGLLIPLLFAVFLAMLGAAPLKFLRRIGVPSGISIFLVAFLLVGGIAGFLIVLSHSLNQFSVYIPQYKEEMNAKLREVAHSLNQRGIKGVDEMLTKGLNAEAAFGFLTASLKGLVGALSNTILVIIFTIFLLVEAAEFRRKIGKGLSGAVNTDRLDAVVSDVQHYLGIKTVTSGITGVLVGMFVFAMGIKFALLWGAIAFLLNYIPFVGSIIASFPAIILSLINKSVSHTVGTAVGYIVINIGVSNFLEPVLMGRRLGLSPFVVLLSLIFWGWVWGPVGMLLSVPLTMVVKIFLEHSKDFRWIALLMDLPSSYKEKKKKDPETHIKK